MKILSSLQQQLHPDFLWTASYQFFFGLGGILLIKYLSTSMTTASYGGYMLLMSIIAFVVLVPFSPFIQGMTRFVVLYSERKQFTEFLIVSLCIFLFFIALYLIISGVFFYTTTLPDFLRESYPACLLFAVTEVFRTLAYALNNARFHRKNICISVFLEYSLKIGLIIFNSELGYITLDQTLGCLTFGNCIALAFIFHDFLREMVFPKRAFRIRALKCIALRVFRFSLPLVIWAPFGWIREMSNRWFLDYFVGAEEVAFYSIIATITMILPLAMQNLFSGYLMPVLYKKENSSTGSTALFLKKITPLACLTIVVATGFVYVFNVEIIRLISDERYVVGAAMLPWMFLVYSIYVFSMILTIGIFAENKTELLILPNIMAGVVSIISGFVLIKFYGLDGAFYSYFLTFISYSVLVFRVVIKNMGK